jgi:hypothetical protein
MLIFDYSFLTHYTKYVHQQCLETYKQNKAQRCNTSYAHRLSIHTEDSLAILLKLQGKRSYAVVVALLGCCAAWVGILLMRIRENSSVSCFFFGQLFPMCSWTAWPFKIGQIICPATSITNHQPTHVHRAKSKNTEELSSR